MILLQHFHIVNGTKSEPFNLNLELNNHEELEDKRKELEKQYCYQKTFTGRKKVSNVFFVYKEK